MSLHGSFNARVDAIANSLPRTVAVRLKDRGDALLRLAHGSIGIFDGLLRAVLASVILLVIVVETLYFFVILDSDSFDVFYGGSPGTLERLVDGLKAISPR